MNTTSRLVFCLGFPVLAAGSQGCLWDSSASGPDQDPLEPAVTGEASLLPPQSSSLVTLSDGAVVKAASDQLLIGFSPSSSASDRSAVNSKLSERGFEVIGKLPELGMLQVRVNAPADIGPGIEALKGLPGVAYVLPNLELTPNRDPSPPSEVVGDGIDGDSWMTTLDAYGAWDQTTGGITPVAVVDTGVALESGHFDGKSARIISVPELGLANPGEDETGHGTAVAALAVSSGNDGFGSAGVAWTNPLYVVDVSESPEGRSFMADDLAGIYAALSAGARIVVSARGPTVEEGIRCTSHFSLFHEYRWALSSAVVRASSVDALVLVSAGSSSTGAEPGSSCTAILKQDPSILPLYRTQDASYDMYGAAWRSNGAVVSATGPDDRAASFAAEGDAITFAAPGEDVVGAQVNGRFAPVSGTSFAAALAAGGAALVYDVLGGDAVLTKDILQATTQEPVSGQLGAGLLDLGAAVDLAFRAEYGAFYGLDVSKADFRLYGAAQGDQIDRVYTLGSINGDGLPDLGVSSITTNGSAGAVYLYYGRLRDPDTLSTSEAEAVIYGEVAGDQFGAAVAPLGDFDGDRVSDFAVGAPSADPSGLASGGRVYLYTNRKPLGSSQRASDKASARIEGAVAGDQVGFSISGSVDFNGDGRTELLIGAPGANGSAGAVYVFFGQSSLMGSVSLSRADMILTGEDPGDLAGSRVGFLGDVDGDNALDLFVGAPGRDQSGTDAGKIYVFLNSDLAKMGRGTFSLSRATFSFLGDNRYDALGKVARMVGDVDADGMHDFAFGVPESDRGGVDAGAAFLFLSSSRAQWRPNTPAGYADFVLLGDAAGDRAGASLGGVKDMTGDGIDDWMVGAPGHSGRGAAYLVSELSSGVCPHGATLSESAFSILGAATGDLFGNSLEGQIDFDADGALDLVVSAPGAQLSNLVDTGVVYIFRGPFTADVAETEDEGLYAGCSTSPQGRSSAPVLPLSALLLVGMGRLSKGRRGRSVLLASLIGGLLLCAGGCQSSDEPTPPLEETWTVDDGLNGVVTDEYDQALPGAVVSVVGHDEIMPVETDADGLFSLPMPSSGPITVRADAAGMSSNIRVLEVEDGATAASVSVALTEAQRFTLLAEEGGRITVDGFNLDFPPSSLVYRDDPHTFVTGEVDVYCSVYQPGRYQEIPVASLFSRTEEIGTTDQKMMRQITAAEEEEATQLLSSMGMVGVEMFRNGVAVDVSEDDRVTLELVGAASRLLNPLDNDRPYQESDQAPLFHMAEDETTWDLWDEKGWEVGPASDGSSTLSFYADVPHFTYWNLDVFVPATKLVGKVYTQTRDRTVVWSGVEINVRGYNRNGGEWHTYTWTGSDGSYCIRVGADTPNVEIWFEAKFNGTLYKVVEYTSTEAVSSEPSCGSSEVSVHNHEVPCEWFEGNGLLSCLGY